MFENQNQLFRYLRLGFVALAFVLCPYFVNRIPVLKSLFQDMPVPVLVFVAVMFAAIVVVGPELNVEESSSEELLRELGKKNGKLIRQRFKSSLDRNCYIPINSVPSPDDLDSPRQQNSESQSSLEPRKPILEISLEARGRLLILGKPGSGKTTELLKLALALGEQAASDPQKPIPVIFELSAWRGEPMLAWMEEQMVMRYSLDPDICGEWLKNDRIVPLLDGLDELGENDNGAKEAIEAIDTLLEDCGDRQQGLVICCRIEDYENVTDEGGQRIRLRQMERAVRLCELTDAQIENYLNLRQKRELWEELQSNPGFMELARSPMLLNLIPITYRDGLPDDAPPDGDACQNLLFEDFLNRKLYPPARRIAQPLGGYNPEKSRYYLAWLAANMEREEIDLREFSIERLQPIWLDNEGQLNKYRGIKGAIVGSIVGLLAWPIFWLIYGRINGQIAGLMFGPTVGVIVAW